MSTGGTILRLPRSARRASGAASLELPGILQADAFSRFNALFDPGRKARHLPRPPSAGARPEGVLRLADFEQNGRRTLEWSR